MLKLNLSNLFSQIGKIIFGLEISKLKNKWLKTLHRLSNKNHFNQSEKSYLSWNKIPQGAGLNFKIKEECWPSKLHYEEDASKRFKSHVKVQFFHFYCKFKKFAFLQKEKNIFFVIFILIQVTNQLQIQNGDFHIFFIL